MEEILDFDLTLKVIEMQIELDSLEVLFRKRFFLPQNRLILLRKKAHELQRHHNDLQRLIDAECRSLGPDPLGSHPSPDQQAPLHSRPERSRAGSDPAGASGTGGRRLNYHFDIKPKRHHV